MSNLWWLQPGWTDARCACCGNKIWPEGDPDWGLCWPCKSEESRQQEEEFDPDILRENRDEFRRLEKEDK